MLLELHPMISATAIDKHTLDISLLMTGPFVLEHRHHGITASTGKSRLSRIAPIGGQLGFGA
jgi:hypothetical protein